MEATKILIDLESLLDIRQAKLLTLLKDEDKVAKIVSSEKYNFRKTDDFSEYVNMNEYNNIKNDINIVKKSILTYMINILRNKILSLDVRNSYLEKKFNYEVLLNVNGFYLTKEEVNLICRSINLKLNINTFILPVNYTVEDLSPKLLSNSDFAFVYIYNLREWLDKHLISLENISLNNTVIYFPALYSVNEEIIKNEEKKLNSLGFNDGFNLLEMLLSEKVKINFLPIVFYNNIITSEAYISKFNSILKETSLKGN